MKNPAIIICTGLISLTFSIGGLITYPKTTSANQLTTHTKINRATSSDYAHLQQQIKWSTSYHATPYARTRNSYNKLQKALNDARLLAKKHQATHSQINTTINNLHQASIDYLYLTDYVNALSKVLLLAQQITANTFGSITYDSNQRAFLNYQISTIQNLLNQTNSPVPNLIGQLQFIHLALDNITKNTTKHVPLSPTISLPNWAKGQGSKLIPSHLPQANEQVGVIVLGNTTISDVKTPYANYWPTQIDTQRRINIQAINQSQQNELNAFTVALINQLRQQLNTPLLKPTLLAQHLANKVVQRYNQDNWDATATNNGYYKGHDTKGLDAIASTIKSKDYFLDEDIGSYSSKLFNNHVYPMQTMADVKWAIHQSIIDMIYHDADSAYGHTKSLLGLEASDYKNPTFSLNFDKYQNIHFVIFGSN